MDVADLVEKSEAEGRKLGCASNLAACESRNDKKLSKRPTSKPIEDTSLDEWNLNQSVLGTGYFLVAREGFRVLKTQGRGGSIVFVASKNGLVAGRNAAAYSSAKGLEIHLARCLAEEGGSHGIRVNTVNPDPVLRDSGIWDSAWREQRALT